MMYLSMRRHAVFTLHTYVVTLIAGSAEIQIYGFFSLHFLEVKSRIKGERIFVVISESVGLSAQLGTG